MSHDVLEMGDRNSRLQSFRILIEAMPLANARLLKTLITYLLHVVANAEVNKMVCMSIIICHH